MADINKSVEVRIGAKLDAAAAKSFKDIQEHAARASKSVKEMQPAAKTTTEVLRKMWSDTKDAAKGSEVQVNRLAQSIKTLGLTTRDVTRMAKEMGSQWKLSAAQIDQALTKAGRARMGGGGFGGGGGGGWGGTGAGLGAFAQNVAQGGNVWELAQAGAIGGAGALAGRGLAKGAKALWPAALKTAGWKAAGAIGLKTAGLAALPIAFAVGAHVAPDEMGTAHNWLFRRGEGQATERMQGNLTRLQEMQLRRAQGAETRLQIEGPFRDQQRDLRLGAYGMQAEAAGLRGLAGTRTRLEDTYQGQGLGLLGQAGGLAPELYKGPAGQDALRGLRERVGDMSQDRAAAMALAGKDVDVARAGSARLAQEGAGLEQSLRAKIGEQQADVQGGGAVNALKLTMERAEIERQISQNIQQRQQATANEAQSVQRLTQTKVQGLQQERAFYKDLEKSARAVATAERERLQGGKEQFGLLEHSTKREALDIAKRLAGGQELTRDQIQIAQGIPVIGQSDLFKKYGADRAGPGWEEILRLVNATRKADQAEKQADFLANITIKMDNEIKAEIKIGEQALAQQLTTKLLPQVFKAIEMMEARIMTEWEKWKRQNVLANRAANAGP